MSDFQKWLPETPPALFLFIDKVVPTSSMTMGEIYVEHKDVDGFLYIQYSGENTFGC
jgi:GABA(A) receptor-associated protein